MMPFLNKPSKTKYLSYKSSSTEFVLAHFLAAKGDPVRARTAEYYLRSIAQKFLELGKEDPRLNSAHNINFRLQRMLSAYKKEDPPPHRVKPVHFSVLHRIMVIAAAFDDVEITVTADMIALGFFFLLRPVEYCISSGATDSDPFLMQDTALFQGKKAKELSPW